MNTIDKLTDDVVFKQLVEHTLTEFIDDTITYVNDYAIEFFGFSKEELIDHNVLGTILPNQKKQYIYPTIRLELFKKTVFKFMIKTII